MSHRFEEIRDVMREWTPAFDPQKMRRTLGGQPPEDEEILAGFAEAFPLLCFTSTRLLLGRSRGLFRRSVEVVSVSYAQIAHAESRERGGRNGTPLLIVRDTGGEEHLVMPGGWAHLRAAATCVAIGVRSTT